jgi:hypothetical protein
VAAVVILSLVLVVGFVSLRVVLEWDDGCSATPDGYFDQQVVSIEPHLLWTTCTLDPNNGEDRYVIHRPWQSVHGS